jgi:hypothetical protein
MQAFDQPASGQLCLHSHSLDAGQLRPYQDIQASSRNIGLIQLAKLLAITGLVQVVQLLATPRAWSR